MARNPGLPARMLGLITVVVAGVLLAVVAMIVFAPRAADGLAGSSPTIEPTAPATRSPSPTAEPTAAPTGPIGTIEIRGFDIGFEPTTVRVAEPGSYTVSFVNDGGILHDVTFPDGTTIAAQGHQQATGEIVVPAEGLSFICSIPGHAQAGMAGEIVVDAGHTGHATPSPSASLTPQEMVDIDAARTLRFPEESEGRGNQPLEPEILPDGTKQWELTASAIKWETEKGVIVDAYAYNGVVPGPLLSADVGDRVRIVLHNELPEPTTIHAHGLLLPPEMDGVPVISQPAVLPGESFTYEFTLRNAGSHMYHSHFMSAHQVPMGLLGAFIVHDPDGDEPESDVDVTMILNDGPLGYTINGKSFPATEPVIAEYGQTVRIRYMNEGLQIHPMHLHGLPQLVIAKDGYLLPQPHYEDTVLVAPGERIDVLVEATEVGTWAFHCHVLTHAEGPDGMFGMVTALVVGQ